MSLESAIILLYLCLVDIIKIKKVGKFENGIITSMTSVLVSVCIKTLCVLQIIEVIQVIKCKTTI